jgi:hypothetical protein
VMASWCLVPELRIYSPGYMSDVLLFRLIVTNSFVVLLLLVLCLLCKSKVRRIIFKTFVISC